MITDNNYSKLAVYLKVYKLKFIQYSASTFIIVKIEDCKNERALKRGGAGWL